MGYNGSMAKRSKNKEGEPEELEGAEPSELPEEEVERIEEEFTEEEQ